MGNPAGMRKKKREKRRLKYEARLGPAVYLPKDERERINAAIAKEDAAVAAAKK